MIKFLHCRNFAHNTGAKLLVGFDRVFWVNFTFVMLRSFCRYFAQFHETVSNKKNFGTS